MTKAERTRLTTWRFKVLQQAGARSWHNGPGLPKSSQLTITLTPGLEAFIQERVASGRFATAGEAVREGLHLLEEREQEREAVLDDAIQLLADKESVICDQTSLPRTYDSGRCSSSS